MMASKKIIAICQSGGEFVTNYEDGTLTYTGGEAYALDVDDQTVLADFKKEVEENFQFATEGMTIKYFLPGNKKTLITISKDKDLKRMINFFKDADQVEIFIIYDEAVVRNVPNVSASRSTTASEAAVTPPTPADMIHCDDLLGANASVDTTPLCSYPGNNAENTERHRRAATQWENTITGVGQRFNSFAEFREALHKYSIAHGFTYRYKKNDSRRVTAKCKAEGCSWCIYASRLPTTQLICIKKMNAKHTCDGAAVKAGYRSTRGWMGSIIKEKLKFAPNYKPKDIAKDIEREYGIQLNYSQARRAKEKAREQLQGSFKEAYSQLPLFCEKIRETNPGSVATIATKEDSSFHRLFIAFHASISGFQQGCCPLLFLDSILLYAKYQGTLLAAVGVDGNDGVFPVAFAVVDEETGDNWHWFLSELKSAVPTSCPITFVSDSQRGIRESLQNVFGEQCYHGFCLRYLAEKLNNDLKGQFSHEARRLMIQDLYAAACASKLESFDRCVENLKAISPEVYNWVTRSEPEHWANAFFGGARYGHLTSNFGQLFYDWVAEVNELPITQMVDALRGKIMELIYTRRVDSSQWVTPLTPVMEQKLQSETSRARSLQVLPSHGSTFEVHGESVEVVDIDQWDCSCREWQLNGLPCCHAIAVFECLGRSPYDHCSRYFSTETYHVTYAESINPIPNLEKPIKGEPDMDHVAIVVTPPPTKRPPGRPKIKKVDTFDIVKRQMQCSKCKGLGHNKKTCGREYAQEQEFFRQTALVSKKEKEKMEMMKAVSFMYVRPPGYNPESAKAAEIADEAQKQGQGHGGTSQDTSAAGVSTSGRPEVPPVQEKKKPRPKDVFGRLLPTEKEFEVLKNAPRLETGVAGRAKPFGIEIRNVKCVRCGAFGHQSGDRECPLKDAIMPNEESRIKRDDPLTAILAQTDASEPLKWELKQKPGLSPPRGGFNLDDPNQQIVAEDIFDEYGGFLTADNVPDLLASLSSKPNKKKKSSKSKHKKRSSPARPDLRDQEEITSSSDDDDRGRTLKKKKHKKKSGKHSVSSEDSDSHRKCSSNRQRHSLSTKRKHSESSSEDDDNDRHRKRSNRHRRSHSSSPEREDKEHRKKNHNESSRGKHSKSSSEDDNNDRHRKRNNRHRCSRSSSPVPEDKEHRKKKHSESSRGKHSKSSSEDNDNDRHRKRTNRQRHSRSSSPEPEDKDRRKKSRHYHHHHSRHNHSDYS